MQAWTQGDLGGAVNAVMQQPEMQQFVQQESRGRFCH